MESGARMLSGFRWWLANQLFDVNLMLKATRIIATMDENDRVVAILRQNVRKTITEKLIVEQIEQEIIKVTLENND
jgi:hypothetical protein